MGNYANNDGLVEIFGKADPLQGSQPSTQGKRKELRILINYDDLPLGAGASATGARNDSDVYVPAGAVVESCKLLVGTAWLSGTNLNIGWYQKAGTAINATGIDSAILTAALTANTVIVCDGALSTNIHASATLDAYVGATVTGTYAAGTGVLVITYYTV